MSKAILSKSGNIWEQIEERDGNGVIVVQGLVGTDVATMRYSGRTKFTRRGQSGGEELAGPSWRSAEEQPGAKGS